MNNIIAAIDGVVNNISGFLYNPWVPVFLLVAGLYFTIRTGLIQIRLFGESIRVVTEKPKDKDGITGYTYEPWHYRFVGREAATDIYFGKLTLEEYLGAEPD